jgi:hypothetical protein
LRAAIFDAIKTPARTNEEPSQTPAEADSERNLTTEVRG